MDKILYTNSKRWLKNKKNILTNEFIFDDKDLNINELNSSNIIYSFFFIYYFLNIK